MRAKIEGANGAEGKNKMRDGENNMWRGETKDYAEKSKADKPRRKKRLRGELKGADVAKEQHKFMREKMRSEVREVEKG